MKITLITQLFSSWLLSLLPSHSVSVLIMATSLQLLNHLQIKGLQPRICKQRNSNIIISKRSSTTPNPRRLITISTGDGRWHGKWDSEHLLSLRDLRLDDLVDDEHQRNAQVSIKLCVQKHASFGFSVDGRIFTSFPRRCSNCNSPYCRKIDTQFNVWVLPSRRDKREVCLPELGDDPSVIYVKPGNEADLDSLIQDTIRITTSIRDTCSESCEKSSYTMHNDDGPKSDHIDKRWSRLLELKNLNP